jgi:hypothetical protein
MFPQFNKTKLNLILKSIKCVFNTAELNIHAIPTQSHQFKVAHTLKQLFYNDQILHVNVNIKILIQSKTKLYEMEHKAPDVACHMANDIRAGSAY